MVILNLIASVGRINQILSGSEVSLRGLDRRMSEEHLDLLKFTAAGPAQLRGRLLAMARQAAARAPTTKMRSSNGRGEISGRQDLGLFISPKIGRTRQPRLEK